MSQMKKMIMLGVLLVVASIVAVGCGTSNSQSPFDADAQKHPAGWLPAGHMTAAQADIAACEECHGSDLMGGISKVSCTTCHLGGPADVHLASYNNYDWSQAGHGQYVVFSGNGATACRNVYCHGNDLKGVANSGPSCSQCHSFP